MGETPSSRSTEYREVPHTNPDPSIRTIEQLQREVSSLKELHGVRLEAMDKAIAVAHDDLVRVPTDVQKAVTALKEVLLEMFKTVEGKFDEVKLQFELIEKQRVEQKADTKAAVDAALTAQKEAVKEQTAASEKSILKSESATKERIDLQAKDLRTSGDSTNQQVSDLKERVTTIEGKTTGHGETWGYVAIGVAIIAVILTIVINFAK